MGKNTPTSALSADLNFCSRLRKMEADSCSAAGMLLALFLSRDRHRYCRMAVREGRDGSRQRQSTGP